MQKKCKTRNEEHNRRKKKLIKKERGIIKIKNKEKTKNTGRPRAARAEAGPKEEPRNGPVRGRNPTPSRPRLAPLRPQGPLKRRLSPPPPKPSVFLSPANPLIASAPTPPSPRPDLGFTAARPNPQAIRDSSSRRFRSNPLSLPLPRCRVSLLFVAVAAAPVRSVRAGAFRPVGRIWVGLGLDLSRFGGGS